MMNSIRLAGRTLALGTLLALAAAQVSDARSAHETSLFRREPLEEHLSRRSEDLQAPGQGIQVGGPYLPSDKAVSQNGFPGRSGTGASGPSGGPGGGMPAGVWAIREWAAADFQGLPGAAARCP